MKDSSKTILLTRKNKIALLAKKLKLFRSELVEEFKKIERLANNKS